MHAVLAVCGLGCSTVELVGVDKVSLDAMDDASVGDASSFPDAAEFTDADVVMMRDAQAPDGAVGNRDAALRVWTDPPRPPPFPDQYINDKFPSPDVSGSPCPAVAPAEGASCGANGVACRYPLCWGGAHRSSVCVEGRFRLWYDESFKCAADRPCPSVRPREGARCDLIIECLYPAVCCDGSEGYESAHCDGAWHLTGPSGCDACPTQPRTTSN